MRTGAAMTEEEKEQVEELERMKQAAFEEEEKAL